MKQKPLKNACDSIRRSLKGKGITLSTTAIESKVLEHCPQFPTDWSSDTRTEVIKALIKKP